MENRMALSDVPFPKGSGARLIFLTQFPGCDKRRCHFFLDSPWFLD
jgi:hypothetical protein